MFKVMYFNQCPLQAVLFINVQVLYHRFTYIFVLTEFNCI